MLVAPRHDTTAHCAAQATSHTEKRKKKEKMQKERLNEKGNVEQTKQDWREKNTTRRCGDFFISHPLGLDLVFGCGTT